MKVIQTWDDGVVSDIRLIELLKRYEARAAFCLTPGLYQGERSCGWVYEGREVWRLAFHELTSVYNGFEICSHSLTHPYLTDLSADQLHHELHASRQILEDLFQKPVLGFCYPFNACNDFVKEAVHRAGYRWARGGRHGTDIYPPEDAWEFHPCCHFRDDDFREKFEYQKQRNSVFFFWGHSYELVSESMWADLENRIQWIASTPGVEWGNIADLF